MRFLLCFFSFSLFLCLFFKNPFPSFYSQMEFAKEMQELDPLTNVYNLFITTWSSLMCVNDDDGAVISRFVKLSKRELNTPRFGFDEW